MCYTLLSCLIKMDVVVGVGAVTIKGGVYLEFIKCYKFYEDY